MAMQKRMHEVCGKQHSVKGSVFPPSVCPFCFGCPIAAIVVGVASSGSPQTEASSIAADKQAEVYEWLDKVEAEL